MRNCSGSFHGWQLFLIPLTFIHFSNSIQSFPPCRPVCNSKNNIVGKPGKDITAEIKFVSSSTESFAFPRQASPGLSRRLL